MKKGDNCNGPTRHAWNVKRIQRVYELKNFKTNLKNVHLTIQKEQRRADMDNDAHACDLSIHPPILQTPSGYPQWQGSETARLLKLDIEEEKHKAMKPSDLHNTKDEYQLFPLLTVFRKHIAQEVRSHKDSIYWLVKITKRKTKIFYTPSLWAT